VKIRLLALIHYNMHLTIRLLQDCAKEVASATLPYTEKTRRWKDEVMERESSLSLHSLSLCREL